MVSNRKNNPSFLQSILPLFFLVVLLAINVSIFKGDSLSGSIQIVLFLSSAFASIIAFNVGFSWNEIQEGIVKSIKSALPSILILFLVGSLAGSWMVSGVAVSYTHLTLPTIMPV